MSDWGRDPGDEVGGALRDRAPEPLKPVDEKAPVSGHVPVVERSVTESAPGHDWATAQGRIFPLLRPVGTVGVPAATASPQTISGAGPALTQPLISLGPCDLVIVYGMAAAGYDVLVNAEHLRSWGVNGSDVHATALANLAAWSRGAGWAEETSGSRRLISSVTGEGYDAVRMLLAEVRDYLASELSGAPAPSGTRVLVGLPERHLLVAGALAPGDNEFPALLRDFVVEQAGAADEPIDRRLFELRDGGLVVYTP